MQIHWSIFIPYIIKWKLNNLPFPMNKGNSYSCGLCACGECYLPIYSILTTASWGRWWCFHFIDEKIRLWEVKDIASMAELECQLAHLSPKYTHTHTHSHTLWHSSSSCWWLLSSAYAYNYNLGSTNGFGSMDNTFVEYFVFWYLIKNQMSTS